MIREARDAMVSMTGKQVWDLVRWVLTSLLALLASVVTYQGHQVLQRVDAIAHRVETHNERIVRLEESQRVTSEQLVRRLDAIQQDVRELRSK
jgi:TolA-binding protein